MKKYFTKNFDQDGANYDQRLVLPGLDKGVMILRDQLGIPHIMAETLSDGFGFLTGDQGRETRL